MFPKLLVIVSFRPSLNSLHLLLGFPCFLLTQLSFFKYWDIGTFLMICGLVFRMIHSLLDFEWNVLSGPVFLYRRNYFPGFYVKINLQNIVLYSSLPHYVGSAT